MRLLNLFHSLNSLGKEKPSIEGNNNEGRVFRLKRTSQSLHKRRKFIECAHCLQPGLVGAGAGLVSDLTQEALEVVSPCCSEAVVKPA